EFNATIDRGRLAKLLSFSLMGQMTVSKHLFVLRREASEHRVEVVASQGLRTLQLDETLTDRFWGLDELTLLDDLKPGDALHVLREHGLALALPIHHQSETCGVLCLGSKMTGQPYQPSDIDLLTALANLAFVSIQNSYLVEEQIEKERLEEEMRLARQIQQKLLPDTLPTMPGTEVATLALPSREVGGDYLDLVKLDDERLLLAIADVTGKGVPASLLMANLQACLQIVVPMELKLERAVAEINRVICRNTDYDKFITFFCGIYHQSSGQFDYVNAGHNPPMLMRADGTLELLETGGLLLGVMAGMPYERGQVTLHPGDVLALFTDGVTEAMSPDEEEYGEDRLEHLLRRHRAASAEVLMDALRADIKIFTADPETLSDDLTTIVFKLVDPER
ncbi:MAG: GAF domain-containing SpoIIE family protein phosphatase, partial [Bacteroidota bacterium]